MKAAKGFSIVVSLHPASYGIGKGNQLPWRIKEDMTFFKNLTISAPPSAINAVIMGRKTYESLPNSFKPLPGRKNIILSRDSNVRERLALPDSVIVSNSLDEALKALSTEADDGVTPIHNIFVIGGESIYREAILSPLCRRVYITEVYGDFTDLDTFFPTISASKYILSSRSRKMATSDGSISYRFTEYAAIDDNDEPIPPSIREVNNEEKQYLNLVKDIIDTGVLRGDRTGTGTVSKFGVQMRFSLRGDIFPLITTKRVFWRGVAEELLWFVAGCTNANKLKEKDIHIWDGNGSRQFLDNLGLTEREEGDLGPVYGFQWRHFGAKYESMHSDYNGKGIDQLLDCIHKIKNYPEDRRIIMTAWNPSDLKLMALPPCHMFCQFYVANGELSCHMYQRSADMGLGVPFNIASYSLLTRMVAQVCGLAPGDFVHSIGDAHVYVNHIDALKVQLQREPKPFPKLRINPEVNDIDGFSYNDFKIESYEPDAAIKMQMAV